MKTSRGFAAALSLAAIVVISTSAVAQGLTTLDVKRIADTSGAKAITKGEIVRIEWPRKEVLVQVDGMPLKPFAGLGAWAAFAPTPHGAMLMGDTVVFSDEVNPALDAAFAAGLEVTAIHNHFFYDEPKVYFMHISGHGDPEKLAGAVKSVWDAIKKVRKNRPIPANQFGGAIPREGKIIADAIENILGRKSQTKDGIVKVSIGREGTMHGVKVGESMGLNTWAAFSGSDELAVVDGDFIMAIDEVQPVMRALRKAGINIVALHNHMMGEQPVFFFLHFWGKGSTRELAQGVKAALDAQKNVETMLSELSEEDRILATNQHVCPVSGDVLGEQGKPYKATVNGQVVFLCCLACEKELLAHPDKYLAKLPSGKAK